MKHPVYLRMDCCLTPNSLCAARELIRTEYDNVTNQIAGNFVPNRDFRNIISFG